MYKIETHLHTSEVSRCSHLTAAEMIERYKDAGYNTVFVTDHFSEGYFDRLGDMPWEDKADAYFSGYENARKAGEKFGVTVLPAMELTFSDSPNDYLVYGATKEFIVSHPRLYNLSIKEFYPLAKELGLLVIQAHPYRGSCYPTPKFVDGIEAYNSNPRHDDKNEDAEAVAKKNGLLVSAGSDAHRPEDTCLGGLLSETPVETVEDFIALIRSGKATLIRG